MSRRDPRMWRRINTASGKAIFTPAARGASLLAWYRLDSLVSKTGTSITALGDKGAGGFNLAASGTDFAFVAADANLGGQPSMNGASGTSVLAATGLLTAEANTTYVFLYLGTLTVTQNFTDGSIMRQLVGQQANGGFYMFAGVTLTAGAAASVGPHALCAVFNGASSALYDGNSTTAIITGNAGANGLNPVHIGSSTQATTSIAEVVHIAGADTQTQRAQMFAYGAARYSQVWA